METLHLNFERELNFRKDQKSFKGKLIIRQIDL